EGRRQERAGRVQAIDCGWIRMISDGGPAQGAAGPSPGSSSTTNATRWSLTACPLVNPGDTLGRDGPAPVTSDHSPPARRGSVLDLALEGADLDGQLPHG